LPPAKSTSAPIQIRPTPADLANLALIEAEIHHRGSPRGTNRTRAIRWALNELATRIRANDDRFFTDPPAA
jgi:hypothetical protein